MAANKKDKDKQSTKRAHKTKDWVARTPLKIGGELRWSTNDTRRVEYETETKKKNNSREKEI